MLLEFFNHKDHKKRCRYEIPMYKNLQARLSFSLCVQRCTVALKNLSLFCFRWSNGSRYESKKIDFY